MRTQTNNRNESGFTFLELLIVLTVVSVISAVMLPLAGRIYAEQSDDHDLEAFIASVYHMQAHSMANNVMTFMQTQRDGKTYIVKVGQGSSDVLSKVDFPDGMRIASFGSMEQLAFNNGQIYRPGAIIMQQRSRVVELRFQMQHGRILIYER